MSVLKEIISIVLVITALVVAGTDFKPLKASEVSKAISGMPVMR